MKLFNGLYKYQPKKLLEGGGWGGNDKITIELNEKEFESLYHTLEFILANHKPATLHLLEKLREIYKNAN